MDIDIYRKLCHDETIVMTRHARQRLVERNIALDDVEHAIRTGRIIEENIPMTHHFPVASYWVTLRIVNRCISLQVPTMNFCIS